MQALQDFREIALEHVGVARVPLPIKVKQKSGGHQEVRALTNLLVDVPASVKGTHLSRLVEVLTEWADEPVDSSDIERLLEHTVEQTGSYSAEVGIRFSYFMRKAAPVYPILKRPDEKYVTEAAHDNPKFVEDVVRDVLVRLRQQHGGLTWLCGMRESRIHSRTQCLRGCQSRPTSLH